MPTIYNHCSLCNQHRQCPLNTVYSMLNYTVACKCNNFDSKLRLPNSIRDYLRPSNLISRLPSTFKLDSQTPSDLQTRFADSLRPSRSDFQTRFVNLRLSNSICLPSHSNLQTRLAVSGRLLIFSPGYRRVWLPC